jgi:hypothetical protein
VTLLRLEPVDRVDATTLVDNAADMLLPDARPVRRWGLSGTSGPLPVALSSVVVGGSTLDFLRAEHGYSAPAAIEDAGFALIEDRQPSFLLGGVLLVTGEVPRTTAFETGLPAGHQAWLAHHALYEAMPQAYRPNSVGSRFELKAASETNVA